MKKKLVQKTLIAGVGFLLACSLGPGIASAVPTHLDPLTIPKYVIPLVIPPVMNNNGTADHYDIAVRQFQQQILPGGIWNSVNGRSDDFDATLVWGYGPDADPTPSIAPDPSSQFNYPAYTVEATVNQTTWVNWMNELVTIDPATGYPYPPGDANRIFLPHLLPIDQTLHWANPGADCISDAVRTDCRGQDPAPYIGPVPLVTHLHGAHVKPESDGYPEAWWLPAPGASDFSCVTDPTEADPINNIYVCEGSRANMYGLAPNTNVTSGVANYVYPNDQPSTTLWYHDHGLGMTRNNVYAGPAGFWLIRELGGGETGLNAGNILPGPAPVAGQGVLALNVPGDPVRNAIREIPIAIQDRSFNDNGETLFYPANRAFFEGLGSGYLGNADEGLNIPFIPSQDPPSDISPIWNPEAFFDVMVVNGVSWPSMDVAPAIYRFRLLDGCNARFLNLSMFVVTGNGPDGEPGTEDDTLGAEIPFYQIGTEQSLLPQVVRIETGYATQLPGDGTDVCSGPSRARGNGRRQNCVTPQAVAAPQQALLMGNAERADVLVDFRYLPPGTVVRMINTGPDEPFGGWDQDELFDPADPATTGQVMQFVVNYDLAGASPTDPWLRSRRGIRPNPLAATSPADLQLMDVDQVGNFPGSVGGTSELRDMALIEEESQAVCVSVAGDGTITYIDLGGMVFDPLDEDNACVQAGGMPFAPKEAVLGYDGSAGPPTSSDENTNIGAQPTLWMDPIVTNPALGATEAWELWNWTADAHPIHLHLVKFKVLGRRNVDGSGSIIETANGIQPWENGWKDTVISYPGEVTTLAATFDIPGLYVWHCHIVEHEDNEMMVPYCVGDPNANGCAGL